MNRCLRCDKADACKSTRSFSEDLKKLASECDTASPLSLKFNFTNPNYYANECIKFVVYGTVPHSTTENNVTTVHHKDIFGKQE